MHKIVQSIKKRNKLYKIAIRIYSVVYGIIRDNHSLCIGFHRLRSILYEKARVELYNKQSLKEYCKINHLKLDVLEEEKSRDVFIPKYYDNSDESQIASFKSPQIYTVKLTSVYVIGGSSFILKEKWALYDMFDMDTDNRFDLRFGSIVSISNKGEVAVKSHETENVKLEKGIFLIGFGSFNYYHLTIELMSKFKYIDENESLDNYPIIVDDVALAIPQFKALVHSLNESRREIIPLKKNTKYEVVEMVYISDVSWMPINVKSSSGLTNEDCRVSKECIVYLRNKVMKSNKVTFPSEQNLKLFISRKSSFLQRLSNETDVASLFKSYGFKVVYPEELSLKEQVELFANAGIVAGTTGAALTNIIYCRPGTTFVSIIPKEYNFNVYSTIANYLGINSLYLDAKIIKKGRKISGDIFELDLNYCERFLREHNIVGEYIE
ncbi:MAG: glycosyltransferase family 61 protein [Dethiosulfatibacter sp.]|nr:glycosyltransferase family 61 protein [Dethiosulfatibacter sp.]